MNEENKLVEVPEIVGYWIGEHKKWGSKIYEALSPSTEPIAVNDFSTEDAKYCADWCLKNSEDFASAWVNGFTIEAPLYKVVFKNFKKDSNILKCTVAKEQWYLGQDKDDKANYSRRFHTKYDLERLGLGWVIDCDSVELIEVKP